MRLIDDAGQVWHKLWSMRLWLASLGVQLADEVIGYLMPEHPGVGLRLLAVALAIGGLVARVVKQPAASHG